MRKLAELFIQDYQIANAMDADASSNHNRNVSTFLRLALCSIHFPPTSSMVIICLTNKLTLIREQHKGPFTIGPPGLNYLGPLDVVLSVFGMNHEICPCHQAEYVIRMYMMYPAIASQIMINEKRLRGGFQTSQP